MFELKEMMKTDIISVKRKTLIYDAIELMVNNNITGLPVVNSDMTLVGIISEKDVLRLLTDLETLMLSYDLKDSSTTVEDYMTKDVISFQQDDDIIAVCECLVKNHFRRVPILNGKKLVGIISRKDLIKYISEPIETESATPA